MDSWDWFENRDQKDWAILLNTFSCFLVVSNRNGLTKFILFTKHRDKIWLHRIKILANESAIKKKITFNSAHDNEREMEQLF